MLSKNLKMLIMVIISLGLIGPVAFIAQQAATDQPVTPGSATPTPPPQTVKLTQIKEYTAVVTADIVAVDPTLILVVESNNTIEEIELEYSNITNATLLTIYPNGPTYTAVFGLNATETVMDAIYELYQKPYTVLDYAMPAEIQMPATYIAIRNGQEHELTSHPSDEIQAMITGRTQTGSVSFNLQITESGSQVTILAFEST